MLVPSHAAPLYSTLGGDADLGVLVEMFVAEMPERIERLCSLYDRGDLDELGRFAHQLKGSLGSYGFDVLTPYALRLEQAVKQQEGAEAIRAALEELTSRCRCVRAGSPVDV
jgi:HPt (histidine-containing phosphotransfer) domain-containing protein